MSPLRRRLHGVGESFLDGRDQSSADPRERVRFRPISRSSRRARADQISARCFTSARAGRARAFRRALPRASRSGQRLGRRVLPRWQRSGARIPRRCSRYGAVRLRGAWACRDRSGATRPRPASCHGCWRRSRRRSAAATRRPRHARIILTRTRTSIGTRPGGCCRHEAAERGASRTHRDPHRQHRRRSSPEEVEASWIAEVKRRAAAIDRGELELMDSEEVMARLRARVRRVRERRAATG
jgi:hypothetical protein